MGFYLQRPPALSLSSLRRYCKEGIMWWKRERGNLTPLAKPLPFAVMSLNSRKISSKVWRSRIFTAPSFPMQLEQFILFIYHAMPVTMARLLFSKHPYIRAQKWTNASRQVEILQDVWWIESRDSFWWLFLSAFLPWMLSTEVHKSSLWADYSAASVCPSKTDDFMPGWGNSMAVDCRQRSSVVPSEWFTSQTKATFFFREGRLWWEIT